MQCCCALQGSHGHVAQLQWCPFPGRSHSACLSRPAGIMEGVQHGSWVAKGWPRTDCSKQLAFASKFFKSVLGHPCDHKLYRGAIFQLLKFKT